MEHSSSTNKIPTALLRHTSFKTEEKFSKQHESFYMKKEITKNSHSWILYNKYQLAISTEVFLTIHKMTDF